MSGKRHHDLPVEPARPEQRRVQDIRTVGRGDDDDPFVAVEPVHLDEELIEGLLALVVTAAEARAPVASYRVDLVDEDDARCVLLGLVEHVADARRADPDEHLDEVGARDREERHLRLTGDGLREQRLAGTRRAHHQDASRDLAAELLELRGVAQEVDQLADLLLGLLDARDVGERHLDLVLADEARAALSERERPSAAAAALHLAHEEYPHAHEQEHGEPGNEYLHEQPLLLGRAGVDHHPRFQEFADEGAVVGLRGIGGEGVAGVRPALDVPPLDDHLLNEALADIVDELGVVHLLGRRPAWPEAVEHRHQHQGDDHPQDQILRHSVHCADPPGIE